MPTRDKRKPRIRLSCTFCREKKLKCNRQHPCDSCVKRGLGGFCDYVSENRSASHVQQQWPSVAVQPAAVQEQSREGEYTSPSASLPGKIIPSQDGTRYINSAHWQAILDDINMVERITNDKEPRDERRPDGPLLLFGLTLPVTKMQLLAGLPPRPVMNRLLSRFFNSRESPLVMFHPPTFEKEYIHFLSNPEAVNMAWLAVLFGVLCCSSRFQTGGADDSSLFDTCLFHTAQCLAMANYTTPGRYKVEAMIMYLGLEYLKASDAQVGVSVLTSILTRLAVHMGYHRDSKHYPRISIFDGEMRRRVYLYLVLMDSALSSQAGVPRTIPKSQSDTELPRNLLDEDLHPDMTILPPSRPEADLTPVAFMLIKNRLLNIATEIAGIASSYDGRSYDKVLDLDQRLQDFYHNIPPLLRMRSSITSIIDPPDVILHRYEHALCFQRERCMLHRRYLSQSRHEAQFAYSHWACLDAAQMILRYQVDLHGESALSEQVRSSGAIFFSSLTTGKYLTAAMIICLELSFRAVEDHAAVQLGNQHIPRENLVQSLQTSHDIWMASRGQSEEARKAAETTGFMLGLTRFRVEVQTEDVIPASGMVGQEDVYPMVNPVEQIPSLELLQGMLNDPSRFDWCLWDTTF